MKLSKRLSEGDFGLVAWLLNCELAVLKAVQRVETGGKGGLFAPGKTTILLKGIFSRIS